MPPRKKTTPEEEDPHAEGESRGGAAALKAAVVDQLRSRLVHSMDMQALRPTLAWHPLGGLPDCWEAAV